MKALDIECIADGNLLRLRNLPRINERTSDGAGEILY